MIDLKTPIALLLVFVGGCAATTPQIKPPEPIYYYELDTATLKRIRDIWVLPPNVALGSNFQELGDVEGLYCQRNTVTDMQAASPEGWRAARDQAKISAAMIGADAISVPRCNTERNESKPKGCLVAMTCRSTAYRRIGTSI